MGIPAAAAAAAGERERVCVCVREREREREREKQLMNIKLTGWTDRYPVFNACHDGVMATNSSLKYVKDIREEQMRYQHVGGLYHWWLQIRLWGA
jgi:hypothetical protein